MDRVRLRWWVTCELQGWVRCEKRASRRLATYLIQQMGQGFRAVEWVDLGGLTCRGA